MMSDYAENTVTGLFRMIGVLNFPQTLSDPSLFTQYSNPQSVEKHMLHHQM